MEKRALIIRWFLDDKSISNLDDSDVEHITSSITSGYNQGELNHGSREVRGWWKLDRD